MAGIKITRISHDFIPFKVNDNSSSMTVGQAIDEQIFKNLQDGNQIMSVGVEYDESEWFAMLKDFHNRDVNVATAAPIYSKTKRT